MSITSTEVATTASQLSSVASWLEQAGDTHVRATASARDGFAALPAVWRGPACELTVRAGTRLVERVEPVGPQLVEAGATVRRAADLGEPIAERLRSLERDQVQLSGELRSATTQATGTVDPEAADRAARRAADARSGLDGVGRAIEGQAAAWEQVCRTTAAQIAVAAAAVRASLPSFAASQPGGGGGGSGFLPGLRDRLERLKDLVDGVTDWFEVADSYVSRLHERMARWVLQVRTTILATASRLTVVIGRGLIATRDRLHVVITQTRQWLYVPPPVWLRRLDRVFGRLRPVASWLGRKLPLVGAGLSGWERWNRDADRPDTTSTERWLRAGFEGGLRTVPQVLLGKLTVGAAGLVGAASGPFAVVTVPLVLAVGIGAGVLLDKGTSWLADKLLDDWQWFQDGIRWTADRVDDLGRWASDRATSVWNGLTETWDTVTSTAGTVWRTATGAAAVGWDTVTDVASAGWDTATGAASAGWSTATDVASARWNVVTDVASAGWDTATGAASAGWSTATDVASAGWDTATDVASAGWDTATRAADAVTSTVGDVVSWRPSMPSFGG